jgi:alkanesulfonate monooxygenase SsuD/methylene tetrahydromethanopterin reductase-like flavin-dependent oxidoreductase (luciferase family)
MEVFLNLEAQYGATYHDQLRTALVAERSGIGGVFRADHVRAFGEPRPPGPSDAWTVLAGLARDTTRVRLGTLMTCAPFRLPAMLALTAAGVDRMSGGRLEVGVGAGWFDQEHLAVGARLDPPTDRLSRLQEYLDVLTGLWSCPAGETFGYRGRFYAVDGNPGLPKPAQASGPPVIVGGLGRRRTPVIAARYAEEYNLPRATPATARSHVALARQACETVGRDPATLRASVTLQLCCGPTAAAAAARARRYGWTGDQHTLVGTPGEILEELAGFARAGIGRVYGHITDFGDDEHIALIGAEVAEPAADLTATPAVSGPRSRGTLTHSAPAPDGQGGAPVFATKPAGEVAPSDRFRVPRSPRTFVQATAAPVRIGGARVRIEAVDDHGEEHLLDLEEWHPLNLD